MAHDPGRLVFAIVAYPFAVLTLFLPHAKVRETELDWTLHVPLPQEPAKLVFA
jgi:hypothetical protein